MKPRQAVCWLADAQYIPLTKALNTDNNKKT